MYEDQIKQADMIFKGSKIVRIPIFNKADIPVYVLFNTEYNLDQTFYCRCLSGESSFDLSINADMTVSCSCQLREAGELGSLNDNSLIEIFNSPKVDDIRNNFAKGELLTEYCLKCRQFAASSKSLGNYYSKNYSLPNSIMIENTSLCNLKCDYCYNEVINKVTMSDQNFEKIVTQLSENNINKIDLFKYGETFADKSINTKVNKLIEKLPDAKISVSTNGFLLSSKEAIEAALKMEFIMVSLDGINDKYLQKFQSGSKFQTVYENMKNLVKIRDELGLTNPYIDWKYVVFDWNDKDEMIIKAFELAIDAGVDCLSFVRGWRINTEETSNIFSRSNVFLPYMEKYKFEYKRHGEVLRFLLNGKSRKEI